MTASTDSPPQLRSQERAIMQPWFDLTGLDELSPEWRVVWAALKSAGLAGDHGLTLWPVADSDENYADTMAAQTVRLALVAGARHGLDSPSIGSGRAVALVLELLYRDPEMHATVLNRPPQEAVQHLLVVLSERVAGTYPDAPSALAAQITQLRSAAAEHWPVPPEPWAALVDFVMQEAIKDEVFAEHVLLQIGNAGPDILDAAVLPDDTWVVLQSAPGMMTGRI